MNNSALPCEEQKWWLSLNFNGGRATISWSTATNMIVKTKKNLKNPNLLSMFVGVDDAVSEGHTIPAVRAAYKKYNKSSSRIEKIVHNTWIESSMTGE